MDKSPEVSVIVTAFNSEQYLWQALESVAVQDFKNFEVVVVDDGSASDSCKTIVTQFNLETGCEVRYVYQQNRGPAAARNRGIAESSAEFIAFLDGDDLFKVYKLSCQLALLKKLPKEYAFVSGGRGQFFDDHPDKISELPQKLVDGNIYLPLVKARMSLGGNPAGQLFRRTALESICGFDEALWNHEDTDLLIRLARKYKVKTHREIVFLRRMRKGSLSNADPDAILKNSLLFIEKLEKADAALSPAIFNFWRQRAFFRTGKMHLLQRGDYERFVWHVKEGVRYSRHLVGWKSWLGVPLAYSGLVGKLFCKLFLYCMKLWKKVR